MTNYGCTCVTIDIGMLPCGFNKPVHIRLIMQMRCFVIDGLLWPPQQNTHSYITTRGSHGTSGAYCTNVGSRNNL